MSEKYIIGIDSGTQSTRALLFDTRGKRVAAGSVQHPKMLTPQLGWVEHGKNDIANGLREAVADMFGNFKGSKEDIIAIGLAAQRCVVIALDENDKMLYNPLSWMDERWKMNFASMGKIETDVEDPLYKGFFPYFSKVNWFKQNLPEVYEKASKFFGVTGYLGYKITGSFCESLSNSLGWPYDLINWKEFDTDAEIELMGMRRDQLAEPVLAGTVIGKVSSRGAVDFGLPEGVPVVMGTGDKQSELLGAGAINHGQAYITLGTLSGLDIVCQDYKPSPNFSYSMFLSACPKLYHFEAAIQKGFWLISWFRDNFCGGLKADAEAQGISIEELLNREATKVPPGADGLVVLPDWSPVGSRPNSKGIYMGFDDRHGRAHMFRALLEGLIIQIKMSSDHTAEQLGLPIKELYIGGGGSKSNLCAQIISDIFGVPVNRVGESENCSLGAAMCAAVGIGVYADLSAAVKNMASTTDQFQPNKEHYDFYDALSKNVIQKIYPALENVLKDLSALKVPEK